MYMYVETLLIMQSFSTDSAKRIPITIMDPIGQNVLVKFNK